MSFSKRKTRRAALAKELRGSEAGVIDLHLPSTKPSLHSSIKIDNYSGNNFYQPSILCKILDELTVHVLPQTTQDWAEQPEGDDVMAALF